MLRFPEKLLRMIIFVVLGVSCQVVHAQSDDVIRVSIIALIATPERFHNKQVWFEGYASMEFEKTAIFLSKEAQENSLSENAIWVNIFHDFDFDKATSVDYKKQMENYRKKFHKKYVQIKGLFDAHTKGHLGLYSGTIKQISHIAIRYD